MKPAVWLLTLSVVIALAGCRTQRLGQDQGVRAIFEAQANRTGAAPAPLTADDAAGVNAKHRAPLAPTTTAAPEGPAPLVVAPLGTP